MSAVTRLRNRLNREADGSFRGSNRRLGAVETAGLILLVAALLLWLLRAELEIGRAWPYLVGAVGLLVSRLGSRRSGAAEEGVRREPDFTRPPYRWFQGVAGLVFACIGLYGIVDGPADALALAAAVAFLALGGNALVAAWRGRRSWLLGIGALF